MPETGNQLFATEPSEQRLTVAVERFLDQVGHGAVVGRRKLARIASHSSASADRGAIFGDLT